MNTPNNVYTIPAQNWHMELAKTIRKCPFGSTIVVATEEMVELGRRANERMCPDKDIWFCTKPTDLSLISDQPTFRNS